jgi:hypothetical protein
MTPKQARLGCCVPRSLALERRCKMKWHRRAPLTVHERRVSWVGGHLGRCAEAQAELAKPSSHSHSHKKAVYREKSVHSSCSVCIRQKGRGTTIYGLMQVIDVTCVRNRVASCECPSKGVWAVVAPHVIRVSQTSEEGRRTRNTRRG